MGKFQCITIPSDENTISGELGIPPDKADFLIDTLKDFIENPEKKCITFILEKITGLCENVNEVVYVSYVAGRMFEEMEMKRHGMMMAMKFIKKNLEDDE